MSGTAAYNPARTRSSAPVLLPGSGMNLERVTVHLMRENERLSYENERLSYENGWLWIALRGCEVEPRCPFPALSGEEVIRILHPWAPYRGRR